MYTVESKANFQRLANINEWKVPCISLMSLSHGFKTDPRIEQEDLYHSLKLQTPYTILLVCESRFSFLFLISEVGVAVFLYIHSKSSKSKY